MDTPEIVMGCKPRSVVEVLLQCSSNNLDEGWPKYFGAQQIQGAVKQNQYRVNLMVEWHLENSKNKIQMKQSRFQPIWKPDVPYEEGTEAEKTMPTLQSCWRLLDTAKVVLLLVQKIVRRKKFDLNRDNLQFLFDLI